MKVYVLAIVNDYGTYLEVFTTKSQADLCLIQYCRDNWVMETGDALAPINEKEMVQDYFDKVERESYVIEECELKE